MKNKKRERIIRKYEIPENILTLILNVEALAENVDKLPDEYKMLTYKYLKDLKTMAGLNEEKYIDWAITDYKHIVEIEFEKEFDD